MRNLKRALSLVMAMAMLIGMMTIGASAVSASDFTDADEIVNTEAVSVLTTLNVINGKEDGSYFDPTGIVTRAEMAKMITVALHGGEEPVLGTKTNPSYSDIKGHWAESYIEYCTSVGIISGRGNGKFDPAATVTVAEAAKMLLTALGYDAAVFGLTGSDWQVKTDVQANNAKLYEGLPASVTTSDALTRDNAAQMIYNTLDAYIMEKTFDKVLSNGEISYSYKLSETKTMMSEKFGVVKVEGVVTENEFTEGSALKGKTTMTVTNGDAGSTKGEQSVFANGTQTFAVTSGADVVGKSVTLYVKPAKNTNAASKATVVGSAIINSNNTVYTTAKALVNNSSKSNDITKTLKAEGLKFDDANDVTLYTNYADSTLQDPATSDLASLLNTKGVEAQYIDNNGDGIVDVVVKVIKAFGKVTVYSDAKDGSLSISKLGKYGADGLTSGAGLSTTDANEDVYDFANLGVAKNDYVFYYEVNGGMCYVEAAKSVTEDITATKGDSIYAGDTEYGTSDLASTTDLSAETGAQATLVSAVTLGEEAVLYLDAANSVVYVTDAETSSSYLMVTATALSGYKDSVTARVVFEDGTTGEIEVNKLDTTTVNNSTNASNVQSLLNNQKIGSNTTAKVYSYTKTSDNTYNLTTETTVVGTQNAVDITKGNPTVVSGQITANNATKFILGDEDGYSAYTGINNVSSKEDTSVFAVVGTNKVAKVLFAYGGTGAENADNYMYVLNKTPYVTSDGKNDVYTYTVIRNGKVTTIEGTSASVFSAAGLNKVTLKGDKANSASTSGTLIVASGKATTAGDGVLAINNGTGYFYDENTVFILITGGGKDDVNTSASVDSIITEGGAQDTISILVDEDNTTTAQYVFIERG